MTAEDIYKALRNKTEQQIQKLIAERDGGALSDAHLDPNDLRGQWARSHDHPTEAERRRLRKGWNDELRSKLPGKISGDHASEIEKSGTQEIDWRAFLSRFMTGLRRDDYRIYPANKKHLWRGIYLPSFGSPGPDHIVVAVDTSGSMDAELLGKILTEIDAARQIADCKLTIIQCDAGIKDVQTHEAWELSNTTFERMKMRGRGGTSLIPPFDWISNHIKEGNPVPDAVIYMTDGFGPSPSSPPMFPCLWVVPEKGATNFSFGNVIKVSGP